MCDMCNMHAAWQGLDIHLSVLLHTSSIPAWLQGDMSATRKFGGTGLGLNITKSLIEAHGGSIHVESVKGTAFVTVASHLYKIMSA